VPLKVVEHVTISQFVFAILTHKANVKWVFSLKQLQWTKERNRTSKTLRRLDGSYLRSTISKEFLVQTSVPSWKASLQRHMKRHIRRKMTTELATRLYTVWNVHKH